MTKLFIKVLFIMPNREVLDLCLELCKKSYESPNIVNGNASAYVERQGDITYIAITGTDDYTDWLNNLNAVTSDLTKVFESRLDTREKKNRMPKVLVHAGFLDYTIKIFDLILQKIKTPYIVLTGHSLGAASATITALLYYTLTGKKPLKTVTFGSPRVFYNINKSQFDDIINVDRIAIKDDAVVFLPPKDLGWRHVGTPVIYDMTTMTPPVVYPKGYDEDMFTTAFINLMLEVGGVVLGSTIGKQAIGRFVSHFLSELEVINVQLDPFFKDVNNFLRLLNPLSKEPDLLEEQIEGGINIAQGIKETLIKLKKDGRNWDNVLEDFEGRDSTDGIFDLYNNIGREVLPMIRDTQKYWKSETLRKVVKEIEELKEYTNELQEFIDEYAATPEYEGQDELAILTDITLGVGDILDEDQGFGAELLMNLYQNTLDQLAKLSDRGITQSDEATRKLLHSLVFLKVLNIFLSGMTLVGLTNVIYNNLMAIHFHLLPQYKQMIGTFTDATVGERTFTDATVEKRNIDVSSFGDEYTFSHSEGSNRIYVDKAGNEYILNASKTETYLESRNREPKILGYIIYTRPDIKQGEVVVYES